MSSESSLFFLTTMKIEHTCLWHMKKILTGLLLFTLPLSSFAKIFTIQFGGIHGFAYLPVTMNVSVGDTVRWIGTFSQYPLQSNAVPSGAKTIGPINVGDTFNYIVNVPGEYDYQCNTYVALGMTGNFTATQQHFGLTNEGREFYLGMLIPSYNSVEGPYESKGFEVFAMMTTHYDNTINVSYFDETGNEIPEQPIRLLGGGTIKMPLRIGSMQMDITSDVPVFRSCHIKSKYPITVTYISVGPCAGGSYLALPVMGLGKNYVAASYTDNPGNGAFTNNGLQTSSYYVAGTLPDSVDVAGGIVLIIATEDGTNVKITPMATTATGHTGVTGGKGFPYGMQLRRGQCYLVRSNGQSDDHDLSGSLIEASKPVAVISGHENASLGGFDPFTYLMEARDFMIEQMIPVEYWDSIGYVSIPLAETTPYPTEGHGDTYRVYCFDSTTVKAELDVQGVSGGHDVSPHRLTTPTSLVDVSAPVDVYSTNGKKINVMQYDERSQTDKSPDPAPSMMTVIPKSRWKTSYYVSIPTNANSQITFLTNFLNVIGTNLGNITVSVNGGIPNFLTSFSKFGNFNSVSNQFPSLKGTQFQVPAATNASVSYFLSSDQPFAAYFYTMENFQTPPGAQRGDWSNLRNEYAAPAGMQLNTGVSPSFVIDTQSTCSGWHLCIRDTGSSDPGIKAVILIDDPDGIYWQQQTKFSNVVFDQTSSDYIDGELHPGWHTNEPYCFDLGVVNPLNAAFALIAVVDNLGNAIILRLNRTATAIDLTTKPATSGRADSIVFPVKKIGDQICTTFVLKNVTSKGGTSQKFNSAQLSNNDTTYKIGAVIPSLPSEVGAQDSLTIQVCYTPKDSSRHEDSLIVKTDCLTFTISLDAHGATGLISAGDLDFGSVTVEDTVCETLKIKNVGSAPFSLLSSFTLSDTINFSIDPKSLAGLPSQISAGANISITICFHPKTEGAYSAGIDWTTDLEGSFKHSIKDHSSLTGIATPKAGVKTHPIYDLLTIRPNPVNGNFVMIYNAPSNVLHVTVTSVLGETMIELAHPNARQFMLDLSKLHPGTYFARFTMPDEVLTRKIVKE
ncbi:MAG: T9SS type A sorting domain-containing protein [Candidatus Kapaibacterium sp.]